MFGSGRSVAVVTVIVAVLSGGFAVRAQPAQGAAAAPAQPFVVEYYYKIKWGHLEEFIELYTKNHYPLLKRLRDIGYILDMSAAYPVNHVGESDRWDFRFTITFRDAIAAHSSDVDEPILKELFPDQAKYKLEEQRRFELMLEHLDVPIRVDDLSDW